MNDRLAKLEAAVRAQADLIIDAQAEIINYLSGQMTSPEFVGRIIRLFDSPHQREVEPAGAPSAGR